MNARPRRKREVRSPPANRRAVPLARRVFEEEREYGVPQIRRLFNLPYSLLRALAAAGFIASPAREGPTRYRFQDLLVLRTASALRAAKLGPAQIVSAIRELRAHLPPGDLLTVLGQAAQTTRLDWEHRHQPILQRTVSRPAAVDANRLAADEHYHRGVALEESDVTAARAAYLEALKAHKHHLEARINLGRLLHLDRQLKEAERVYRQAKGSSALLSYNLANLLEDLNREEEAIVAYRQALARDPDLHDAHFNLSLIHERARRPREALRHLLAYRRRASAFEQ